MPIVKSFKYGLTVYTATDGCHGELKFKASGCDTVSTIPYTQIAFKDNRLFHWTFKECGASMEYDIFVSM